MDDLDVLLPLSCVPILCSSCAPLVLLVSPSCALLVLLVSPSCTPLVPPSCALLVPHPPSQVKKYTSKPEFKTDLVKASSAAAAALCTWVLAIEMYAAVAKEVAPKRAKVRVGVPATSVSTTSTPRPAHTRSHTRRTPVVPLLVAGVTFNAHLCLRVFEGVCGWVCGGGGGC